MASNADLGLINERGSSSAGPARRERDKPMRMQWPATLLVAVCAACTPGIKEGAPSPSRTIVVPESYQEVYRRADAYARACWGTPKALVRGAWPVSGNIYTDTQTAVLRVGGAGQTADLERFEIRQLESGTEVKVTVWGRGIVFDEDELERAASALATGTPGCPG